MGEGGMSKEGCPFPWTGDNGSQEDCIMNNHCGCGYTPAWLVYIRALHAIIDQELHDMKTSDLLAKHFPIYASLEPAQREIVHCYAYPMIEAFNGGAWHLAREIWQQAQAELNTDCQAAVWEFLGADRARERAYLKGENRKYLNNGDE